MMIDTKKVLIEDTIEMLAKAEDVLNVIMGRLPTILLNNVLYTVITDLQTGIENLQYIDRHLTRGAE